MATDQAKIADPDHAISSGSRRATLSAPTSGKGALDGLPNEIWESIFKWLSIRPPAVGTTLGSGIAALETHRIRAELVQRKHGLRSLCLVSKTFSDPANGSGMDGKPSAADIRPKATSGGQIPGI